MNLLKEISKKKAVIATSQKKKITIDGLTQEYTVYKIKLDMLYYNDQNDRIATWITQYKEENNVIAFDLSNKSEYNKIIHEFITESNKDKIKKTQINIEKTGQKIPGVVLLDGRIIDGNRRFTCLRNIQNKTSVTGYFEAVILDRDIDGDKKQIKMMELQLQHGEDEKVSYNAIDKLVGLYNDLIDTKLLTIDEYASSVGESKKDVRKEVEVATLLGEFLEFINSPKQFHLARIFELVHPLQELYAILRKTSDEDLKEDLKLNVFAQIAMMNSGDKTRYMRKIKRIADDSRLLEQYIQEGEEFVEKVCEKLGESSKITPAVISKIQEDEDVLIGFNDSTEKYLAKADSKTTRNLPLKQLDKACDILELINADIFKKLTQTQKEEITEKIEQIEEMILEFRSELNV